MAKILGLDLGTNSIGWAVVEKEKNEDFKLIDKGVRIFQEGVKIEKGVEGSKAAERTAYRSARRLKYRRKLRKIEVLKVLSEFGYCPPLTNQELRDWRYKGIYPINQAFRNWQKTDEIASKNPYRYRALAVESKFDLNNEVDRFRLGRAFYHLAQRRGFLSNRLETTKESDGTVKKQIEELNTAKKNNTLGQYFYNLYQKGIKIRGKYTHREKHYLEEFNRIIDFQQLPSEFVDKLHKAIFYQRPLKSQKGLVGNCPFEKNKPRCPVSHPRFEEYRMHAFINNIKLKTPDDDQLRYLNIDEKETIIPLFMRKSKEHFKFEDIAKRLTPKGAKYSYIKRKERSEADYLFNHDMRTSVSGCHTTAQLIAIFGANWEQELVNSYTLKEQKTGLKSTEEIVTDIWHVLFSFDKAEKLVEFAQNRLRLDEQEIREFSKIKLKHDYGALSLKAIRKILPYLRQGLIYSHAVFMAKLEDLVPKNIWSQEENRKLIQDEILHIIQSQSREKQLADIVNGIITMSRREDISWSDNEFWQANLQKDLLKKLKAVIGNKTWEEYPETEKEAYQQKVYELVKQQMSNNLGRGEYLKSKRTDERIRNFITDQFDVDAKQLEQMYHPSAVEVYRKASKAADGNYYLGSPLISAIKNPMAMRALHQLRKVVNELIKNGVIDSDTKINIEMARDLKNANERKALQRWQNKRRDKRKEYQEELRRDYLAATGKEMEPSENDILKYQLWEEQKHICLYTGENIGLTEFIGDHPKYDLEHTIPRSLSFDNSQENLSLCNSQYNQKIKRNRIPSELPDHETILQRIEHWKKYIEEAKEGVEKAVRQSRANADNKEVKDAAIQRRHLHQLNLDYWKSKYHRFEMKEVPEGFKNSQLVDIGIITKYARLYLKTVFNHVYTVKGKTVADYRKLWGIQDEFVKKERINHIHHCIDAITIACMSKEAYEQLANAYHEWEELEQMQATDMPQVSPPWPNFASDLKLIENEVFISQYTPDVLPKRTRKILKKRGQVVRDKKGNSIIVKGDSVRGALHKDTNYGAIKQEEINKKGEVTEKTIYVVRKPIDALTPSDVQNIVDDNIRSIVEKGKKEESKLRKDLEKAQKQLRDAEKQEQLTNCQQTVDQLLDQLSKIYAIPNKDGSYTPIKKVRCKATTVTNPLKIKAHRDQSKKEHKQYSYFVNDGNYAMVVYEGLNKKGEIKRDFSIVNNLEAGKYFNMKESANPFPNQHPKSKNYLKYILKTGSVVLFWKDSPAELKKTAKENVLLLYKIVKMSKNGQVTFKFHQEARNDESLKTDYENKYGEKAPKSLTNGVSTVNFDFPAPKLLLSPSNFNFLVEGYEFKISTTGKLEWLK